MGIPFEETRERLMQDPEFRREFDALEDEFALLRTMLDARKRAGLTQEALAKRMGVSQPAVAKIESGKPPSLRTLRRYAAATGSKLKIELIPA